MPRAGASSTGCTAASHQPGVGPAWRRRARCAGNCPPRTGMEHAPGCESAQHVQPFQYMAPANVFWLSSPCSANQGHHGWQYRQDCIAKSSPGTCSCVPIPAYMHGPQEEGNYRSARGKLLTATQQLRRLGSPVPAELSAALTLLHSYVLVKNLIGLDDHMGASRMLARVAASISRSVHALQCTCKEKPMTSLCQASVACTCSASNRFPRHIVPILTSTVIECQRSGLRATALQYAAVLMLPEHRCVSAQRLKHESMSYERCSRGNSDSDSAGEPQQHPFLHYMPAHTHTPLDTGRM